MATAGRPRHRGHVRPRPPAFPSRSKRRPPRPVGPARPARRPERRARRRARHGRQRHRRRRPRWPPPARSCRCPSSSSSPTSARRSSSEASLVFAISFSGNTEETLQAATDAALQGAKVVAITAGGELAHLAAEWGAPLIAVSRRHPPASAAIGAMAVPAADRARGMGLFRGAAPLDRRRRRPTQAPARPAGQRPATPAPRPTSPGRSAGPPAHPRWRRRSAPPPPSAGRPRSTRTPRARPSGAPSPSCATTRSAAGASPATSPASSSPLVHCATTPSTPRSAGASSWSATWSREVVADVIEVRAEGDGDLAQLFDLILLRRLRVAVAGGPGGDRSRPGAGARPSSRRPLASRRDGPDVALDCPVGLCGSVVASRCQSQAKRPT